MDEHPFAAILTKNWEWVEKFLKWERLRPEMQALKREYDAAVRIGDRDRKLRQVCKNLALLRAEIAECEPPSRFLFNNAKVICDAWSELVTHWRELQRGSVKPVGPCGEKLTETEREAWLLIIKGR